MRRLAPWLPWLAVVGVLFASVASRAPARLGFTPCIFRNLTGLPCAGCGMTRGFVAMGHGGLRDAWRHNPLAPVLFLGACGYAVLFLLGRVWPAARLRPPSRRGRIALYGAALLLVLASWSLSLARHFADPSPRKSNLLIGVLHRGRYQHRPHMRDLIDHRDDWLRLMRGTVAKIRKALGEED